MCENEGEGMREGPLLCCPYEHMMAVLTQGKGGREGKRERLKRCVLRIALSSSILHWIKAKPGLPREPTTQSINQGRKHKHNNKKKRNKNRTTLYTKTNGMFLAVAIPC